MSVSFFVRRLCYRRVCSCIRSSRVNISRLGGVEAVVLALRASDGWAESSDEKRVEEKGAHHVRVVSVKCVVSRRVNDHRVEGGLGGARNVCVVRV